MDKFPKKKIVLCNFSHGLFSLLYFLTSKDGAESFSQNNGQESTTQCCVIPQKSAVLDDDLAFLALV
jgi:hypothetical protein